MPRRSQARPAGCLSLLTAGVSLAALMAAPADAQPAPPAAASAAGPPAAQAADLGEDMMDEVVVNGISRPRGSVIGDIKPELVLTPSDVRAYGVTSVSDLIDALAPQLGTSAGGGRPVILINGARISGFAEIRDLPTEAIARVDILPEEVSLKYGYPADQRVLNLVLRPRFRAFTAEAGISTPTRSGGGQGGSVSGAVLHILRERRLQLSVKATGDRPILQSDRAVAGFTDNAYRTLKAQTGGLSVNGVVTRPLGRGMSGTLNGTVDSTRSDSRLGLSPFAPDALKRYSETLDGRLGAVVNGAYAGWQWSYTGAVERAEAHSTTERAVGVIAYTDRSRSVTTTASSDIVLNRALLRLPAGQASATVAGKVQAQRFDSDSLRAGVARAGGLGRDSGEVRASLDLPITRRGDGAPVGVGSLSANLNLSAQNLSDFGGLTSVGYGLHWTPITPLRILASATRSGVAPTVNELGDPAQATPGVRVFDLRRGVTADITRIDGGNAALGAGERQVLKLGMIFRPFDQRNLTLQANYTATHTRDGVAAFPSASTQVESAFPERFVRDAAGALVQIDARPVNFARQDREELRYGFTVSRTLPSKGPPELGALANSDGTPNRTLLQQLRQSQGFGQRGQSGPNGGPRRDQPAQGGPPPEGAPPPGAQPPGGSDRAGGFGGGFGRGGFGGGRGGFGAGVLQIGVYHTVALRDDILIRPGLPTLNLLDGAAIGQGGGSPRHQIDLQANYAQGGRGVAMNARWRSGTRVDGQAGGSDLEFSSLTTVNLRLFADLGSQRFARGRPWLRGARATLAIDNLFDRRQQVRTAAGAIPVSYQPDLLDPVGRSVRLSVRKLFF